MSINFFCRRKIKPEAIVGDLDSIKNEHRIFYEQEGVIIVDKSEDQDTTDLEKCLSYL